MLSDNEIRELLQSARTVAIVGMSDRSERDSFAVARFLQRNSYRIVPVNPNLNGRVLGEQSFASLREICEPVDCRHLSAAHVPGIVEEAIAIGAKAVWMQLGWCRLRRRAPKQAGLRW